MQFHLSNVCSQPWSAATPLIGGTRQQSITVQSPDPYKTPESNLGARESNLGRQWIAFDILAATILLCLSVALLNQTAPGFLIVSVSLGLFFFVGAFCVFRAYRFSRYLMFSNGLLFGVVPTYFIYLGGMPNTVILSLYYGVALMSFFYGWRRYKNQTKRFSGKHELRLFALSMLAYICLLAIVAFLLPPKNITGPVILY